MKLYKITDEKDQTYKSCQWGENITVKTSGSGKLCGPGFTHWYDDPLLAILLNPAHGNYNLDSAHLWEGEGDPVAFDCGLKFGCMKAKTIKRIDLPQVSITQKIAFGILCAMEVCHNPSWVKWAKKWLSGEDRSSSAAYASAYASYATSSASPLAAYAAAVDRAAYAANAAARATTANIKHTSVDDPYITLNLKALAKKAMTY